MSSTDEYGDFPPPATISHSNQLWKQLIQSVNYKQQVMSHRRGFRARKACDNCRNHKAKCDEERPCGNCRERKVNCTYIETPLRKDEKDLLMNLLSLEARMESKVDEFRSEMSKWRQELDEKVDLVLRKIGRHVEQPIQSTTSQYPPLRASVQADSDMSDVDTGKATDGHTTVADGLPAGPTTPGAPANQITQASQSCSSPDIQALAAGSHPTIQGSSTGSNENLPELRSDSWTDSDGFNWFEPGAQATPPRFYEDFLMTSEEEESLESMVAESTRNHSAPRASVPWRDRAVAEEGAGGSQGPTRSY